MASKPTVKRTRATAEQLQQMTDFFLEHPGLAGGKFQKLHGKLEHDKKWSELTIVLNSLGGAVKTVEQWHSVWRDLKCRASTKVRDRKRQQALTGNMPLTTEPASELEKRVIAIIGNEYVEGHDTVPENVLEQEEFQLRLEEDSAFCEMLPIKPSLTPKTPSEKTPRRSLKRKREEENEVQAQFLKIAQQQADALKELAEANTANVQINKMMAEANAANVEVNKMMAAAILAMGQGLSDLAKAIDSLK